MRRPVDWLAIGRNLFLIVFFFWMIKLSFRCMSVRVKRERALLIAAENERDRYRSSLSQVREMREHAKWRDRSIVPSFLLVSIDDCSSVRQSCLPSLLLSFRLVVVSAFVFSHFIAIIFSFSCLRQLILILIWIYLQQKCRGKYISKISVKNELFQI